MRVIRAGKNEVRINAREEIKIIIVQSFFCLFERFILF